MTERSRASASSALDELNGLPRDQAARRLRSCCAAERWAGEMADRRPFPDLESLLKFSDETWGRLEEADWRAAIADHPRLGDRELEERRFDRTRDLSRLEQAGVLEADREIRDVLVRAQRAYERRFGFIFLVCASGRSAADILEELERRMANDPATELAVAAEELRKITRLRLLRVFGEGEGRTTNG